MAAYNLMHTEIEQIFSRFKLFELNFFTALLRLGMISASWVLFNVLVYGSTYLYTSINK